MAKILVIDDDDQIRSAVLSMLGAEGYNVFGAEEGRMGIQLAHKVKPDLILCDVNMPDVDGFMVLTSLQESPDTASIPFIFLTGRRGTGFLREGMSLGADDYIAKPFKRDDLLKAIQARINKSRSQQQQTQSTLVGFLNKTLPNELASPVGVILSASQILLNKKDELDEESRYGLIKEINSYANRLNRLMRNLLLFADLQVVTANPAKMENWPKGETEHPTAIISEIAHQIATEFNRARDLDLSLIDAPVNIPDIFLKKVVFELVDNAFKFSSEGSQVRVVGLKKGGKYNVYIMDKGRGFSEDQINKIMGGSMFERYIFEQQGSGLGLTIARRLVELNRGTLTIESFPGLHTTVSFTIPLINN